MEKRDYGYDGIKSLHVICECKRCKQKLMECDYTNGNFQIEMRCTRCTRALIIKGLTFARLLEKAHGQDKVVFKI